MPIIKILEALKDIRTPLILAGFVTALVCLVFYRMLGSHGASYATIKLLSKYLFVLALVAIVLGVLGFAPTPPKVDDLRVRGTVFVDKDVRNGVAGATVYIKLETTHSTVADEHGEFVFALPKDDVGKTIQYWAEATGYKKPDAQSRVLEEPVAPLEIMLTHADATVAAPAATPPTSAPAHNPPRTESKPAGVSSHANLPDRSPINTSPASSSEIATSTNTDFYESQYSSNRTNELALARAGEAAFNRGDYEWSLKFLQQAKAVSSSGVWQSCYPFLAGDLFMLKREAEATQVLRQMLLAIDAKQGYLSHPPPLGMIIANLGTVRSKVPQADQAELDKAIDHVVAVKSSLPD